MDWGGGVEGDWLASFRWVVEVVVVGVDVVKGSIGGLLGFVVVKVFVVVVVMVMGRSAFNDMQFSG